MKFTRTIPRAEVVAIVTEAVESVSDIHAADAILLKRQAEQAPRLAFGMTRLDTCACPAARAGLSLASPAIDHFATAYDRLVCEHLGLDVKDDYGTLVIA